VQFAGEAASGRRCTIAQTHDRRYNAKPGVVTGDSHHAQTLCPDGKNHDDKNPYGEKAPTKTGWQSSTVLHETDGAVS